MDFGSEFSFAEAEESIEAVDPRRIRSEAKTLMASSRSIDRTIHSHIYATKLVSQPSDRSVTTENNDSVYINDCMSAGSPSLAPLSMNSFSTVNNNIVASQLGEAKILPLSQETRFLSLSWTAFKKFGVHQILPFANIDGNIDINSKNSREIYMPIENLPSAITALSNQISNDYIARLIDESFPSKKAMLSWKEFKHFVSHVFSSWKEYVNSTPSSPTLRGKNLSTNSITSVNGGNSVASRHSHTYEGHFNGVEFESSVHSNMSKDMKFTQSPFDQLMQKSRSATFVSSGFNGMTQAPAATKPHTLNTTSTTYSERRISKNAINDALIQRFKEENRLLRKLQLQAKDVNTSIDNVNSIIGGESMATRSFINNSIHNGVLEQPSFTRPLEKQQIYEVNNMKSGVMSKWKNMKEKRDERYAKEERKAFRQDMLASFNRAVINEERNTMNQILMDRHCSEIGDLRLKVKENKSNEALRLERIASKKHANYLKTVKRAEKFKDALKTSQTLNKMAILNEVHSFKREHASSFKKLPSYTSLLVPVPKDINDRIIHAKRLTDYEQARKDAKEHFEMEVKHRLEEYSKSKVEALFKAANVNIKPIILAPITANDFFVGDDGNSAKEMRVSKQDEFMEEYIRRSAMYNNDDDESSFCTDVNLQNILSSEP